MTNWRLILYWQRVKIYTVVLIQFSSKYNCISITVHIVAWAIFFIWSIWYGVHKWNNMVAHDLSTYDIGKIGSELEQLLNHALGTNDSWNRVNEVRCGLTSARQVILLGAKVHIWTERGAKVNIKYRNRLPLDRPLEIGLFSLWLRSYKRYHVKNIKSIWQTHFH